MHVSGPLLDVRGLSISNKNGVLVSDVSFRVNEGERVGIVGESGSGKSLSIRALMGLLPSGMHVRGNATCRTGQLDLNAGWKRARSGFGMIFQDPFTMLNPLMPCRDHILESLPCHHPAQATRAGRQRIVAEKLAEVGIADEAVGARHPFELSGGMRQRVGIAAALAPDPEVLFADEPTTALDPVTQAAIMAQLRQIQAQRRMGIVLVTHDLELAFAFCTRIYVLYAGRVIEEGPPLALRERPLHPYTRSLIDATPPLRVRLETLPTVAGRIPAAARIGNACGFAPRCAQAVAPCFQAVPPRLSPEPDRYSACLLANGVPAAPRMRPADAAHGGNGSDGNDIVLNITGLGKNFGAAPAMRQVLRDVSLTVRRGECVGIIGGSGSGKTTLGRCIIGLEKPDAGSILFEGVDISDYRRLSGSRYRWMRQQAQMAFQDPFSTLTPTMTIGQTLHEILRLDGRVTRQRIDTLLADVGLSPEYAARRPRELSGGERQRVALARALARQPALLVCDEIVSALDVLAQAQILNMLNVIRVRRGISSLFISHDLAVVRQVATRVYVLHHGMIVEEGETGRVLDNPRDTYTRSLIGAVPHGVPA
ncbi:ABC transporter ATP-binding protein [Komagataeibacter xylinus]|uniref:ABC transporter ATP-binding protein n=1 Tax=Komagataeibacter xylinus TaxID=28448 RepID=A0A857FRR1_KOMXY|nr:ABC transporter ATP-binding protein [Komagataeibacter xylinus]